jgi:hypothetical protein
MEEMREKMKVMKVKVMTKMVMTEEVMKETSSLVDSGNIVMISRLLHL